MNGRVYDPNLGRFLSVDPVFQFPTNTQSLDPYSYVLNNPLSLTDPTGYTSACSDVSTTSASSGMCSVSAGSQTTYVSYSVSSKGDVRLDTGDAQHAASLMQGTNGASNSQGPNSAQTKPADSSNIGSPATQSRQNSDPTQSGTQSGTNAIATTGSAGGPSGSVDPKARALLDAAHAKQGMLQMSGFTTYKDADVAAQNYYLPLSIAAQDEAQWIVVQLGTDNFGFTYATSGTLSDSHSATNVDVNGQIPVIARTIGLATIRGMGHTHPFSDRDFSGIGGDVSALRSLVAVMRTAGITEPDNAKLSLSNVDGIYKTIVGRNIGDYSHQQSVPGDAASGVKINTQFDPSNYDGGH